jgi:hypothetical protein
MLVSWSNSTPPLGCICSPATATISASVTRPNQLNLADVLALADGSPLEVIAVIDLADTEALDAGASVAEAAVLARHANAKVTGQIYAGVSESAKAKIASKLVAAGFGK